MLLSTHINALTSEARLMMRECLNNTPYLKEMIETEKGRISTGMVTLSPASATFQKDYEKLQWELEVVKEFLHLWEDETESSVEILNTI